MADRYELSAPRDVGDKTYWTNNLGVMFPSKSGDGFTIILNAVPVPNSDGQIKIIAKPPFEKDSRGGSGGGRGGSDGGGDYDGY